MSSFRSSARASGRGAAVRARAAGAGPGGFGAVGGGLQSRASGLIAPEGGAGTDLWSLSERAGQGPEPPSPLVMERFSGVISQLFKKRIIRMGGAVDDEMANLIVAQMLYLDSEDPEADITMYINSPGGSVTA